MSENLELKDIVSLEYVKAHLTEVITEVEQGEGYKIITRDSKPLVALVKAAEYRAVYESLDELGETSRPFTNVVKQKFSIRDILDEQNLTRNFDQIFEDVARGVSQKVLLKNNVQVLVITKADNYIEAEQRLFALELQQTVEEMKEEYKRGELIDFDELVAEWGIELPNEYEEPEGYDQMIPERYRNVS